MAFFLTAQSGWIARSNGRYYCGRIASVVILSAMLRHPIKSKPAGKGGLPDSSQARADRRAIERQRELATRASLAKFRGRKSS